MTLPRRPRTPTTGRGTRPALAGTAAVVILVLAGAVLQTRAASSTATRPTAASGGASAADADDPAISRLDPALRQALGRASTAAAADGIELVVNSGWRSPEEQARLFEEAVTTYGSRKEAARWVASPETSAHVSGDAVDIGPPAAAAWLSRHGEGYGLCRTYRNETWHFELRPDAVDHGCPPMYADPTYDPRMQR